MPQAENPEQNEASDSSQSAPKVVTFDGLADGKNEVVIEHNGQQYRLRTTRNGGLILNK